MDHGEAAGLGLFMTGTVLLGAALIFVLLFRKLGLGAVLGYLIAGILVGPHGLGLVDDGEVILQFSEIGIVLLLFLVGLELAPKRLWRMRRDIFGLGLLQVALAGIALSALIFGTTPFTLAAALALGLPLALSSTAQVLPMLQSAGRLNSPLGERAFSILLFQDLSIVPLLTIVAALSRSPDAEVGPPGWQIFLWALVAIAGLILAGRYVLSPLLRIIGGIAERELFIVAGLLAVCAGAALMSLLGLSPALGAFIAGVMLADSPFRHELEADIDPFRSILLGLFFLSVGMLLDLDAIAARPEFVIGMAAMLIITKLAVLFGIARLFGVPARGALILAMLLSQGGEFAFVLFGAAERGLLIDPEAVSLFNAVVTLSMATTPFLMLLAGRLGGVSAQKVGKLDDPADADNADAIVVGHGRFGQSVAQILSAANFGVTLIDRNPQQIARSEDFGRKVFYGDGTRIDLLRRAGAEQAQLLFLCMDGPDLNDEQLHAIATSFPDLTVLARVYDRVHYLKLKAAPHAGLQREVMESAINLARQGLAAVDVDAWEIEQTIDEFRRRDKQRLSAQHETQDMHAADHLTFGTSVSAAWDNSAGSAGTSNDPERD